MNDITPLQPQKINASTKNDLITFSECVLSNVYFEPSYDAFKNEYIFNLKSYLCYSTVLTRDATMQILATKLKSDNLFKDNPYSIPLFFLTFSLSNGGYDSRNCYVINNINQILKLNLLEFEKYENELIHLISETATDSKDGAFKNNKYKKYCKIVGASIVGGTLLGLTGGLIAPFLAASSGIILGSAGATMLGTTAGISIIGSLFGLTGATLTGYKMNKRTGCLKEFRFESLHQEGGNRTNNKKNAKSLAYTIAVSGWVTKDCAFTTPWQNLRVTREGYALCWESEYLLQFGHGINYLVNWAAGTAVQEVLQQTVLAALLSSISWPLTLISLASVIDNPWGVCFARTQDVGKELANVLLSRVGGRRPVHLVGFSLGARVIFHALNYLARLLPTKVKANTKNDTTKRDQSSSTMMKARTEPNLRCDNDNQNTFNNLSSSPSLDDSSPATSPTDSPSSTPYTTTGSFKSSKDPRGIIGDVILIGAPIPASDDKMFKAWMDLVSGTLTNCYCKTDWILKFLYRTSSAQYRIAGLEPIIYNIDSPPLSSKTSNQTSTITPSNIHGGSDLMLINNISFSQSANTQNPDFTSTPNGSCFNNSKKGYPPPIGSIEKKQPHPRIINIDITSIVTGHNDYVNKMPDILKTLGYHPMFYND